MDKIQEYRVYLKDLILRYIGMSREYSVSDTIQGRIGGAKCACEVALKEFNRIFAEQPALPAESLHEAAKRWMAACATVNRTNKIYEQLAHFEESDRAIDELRQWAAENPPKAALTGVCALCSNADVGCGNCTHNPNAVDHFARRKDAPTPPEDGVCESCQNDNCGEFEWPCNECTHGGGKKEYYAPKAVKTYREDFFEKFPDAKRRESGYPLDGIWCFYKAKYVNRFDGMTFEAAWDKPLGYWES